MGLELVRFISLEALPVWPVITNILAIYDTSLLYPLKAKEWFGIENQSFTHLERKSPSVFR